VRFRRGVGDETLAHDWLEVSALGEELLGLEIWVVAADVVVAGVVVAGAEALVTVLGRASAGSWPEMSSIVISSQVTANMASALASTRRRMPKTRAARAWRMAIAAGAAVRRCRDHFGSVGDEGAMRRDQACAGSVGRT